MTSGRRLGRDRLAELRDRDLEVRQELEQERLELVVGAVDLVDEQDDGSVVLERLEQRAAQQEAPREQLALVDAALGGAQREELARVVPVVERLVDVDALVALQADEARAGRAGERLGDLRLAHARLALDEQRQAELGRRGTPRRPAGGRRGSAARAAPRRPRRVTGGARSGRDPGRLLSALRVSTRARWRL